MSSNRFLRIARDTLLADILQQPEYSSYKSIVFVRPVQSGKTADCLKVAEAFYESSAIVFISDKNTALAGQTTGRAKSLGFEIVNYRDDINIGKWLYRSVGAKKVLHLMMEINNLKAFHNVLEIFEDIPVTLIIDEADKSRATYGAEEKEDEDSADADGLPPITSLLLKIKNLLKVRDDSRTVFVSASPQGILVSEKDDWLVIYKDSYKNYVGVGLDRDEAVLLNGTATDKISSNLFIRPDIRRNFCKTSVRWTGSAEDLSTNTFYPAVDTAVRQFVKAPNRCADENIMQLCLISLENRKAQQFALSQFVREILLSTEDTSTDVLVFNSDTKEDSDQTLADLIRQSREAGHTKLIVIAGFMASRGVSFTDFSDPDNQFELILQVTYTKKDQPLNSSIQSMRIFGPARRTVNTPAIICNDICAEDLRVNFREMYRVVRDIAENKFPIRVGGYNTDRKLTQSYNFRYLRQGNYSELLFESVNPVDHLPIA